MNKTKTQKQFHYSNIQHSQHGGTKTVRKVIIKKGKGYKSVSYYKNGKRMKTVKRPLKKEHISLIQQKKFIPGLFCDCKLK